MDRSVANKQGLIDETIAVPVLFFVMGFWQGDSLTDDELARDLSGNGYTLYLL